MSKAMQNVVERDTHEMLRFNYNKLQAVACIVCSSIISIGLIYWLVEALS